MLVAAIRLEILRHFLGFSGEFCPFFCGSDFPLYTTLKGCSGEEKKKKGD